MNKLPTSHELAKKCSEGTQGMYTPFLLVIKEDRQQIAAALEEELREYEVWLGQLNQNYKLETQENQKMYLIGRIDIVEFIIKDIKKWMAMLRGGA